MLQTDLAIIADEAEARADENQQFIQLLKSLDGIAVDEKVAQLNAEIEPQVDCTVCGNCCKTLMINVEAEEADRLAAHLRLSRTGFDERYLEKSEHSDRMLVNAIPCHFLEENKCTVYPYRFAGCREFPALDKPYFTKRLFTVFMHYGRCPIIYNVVERLRAEL
ncbi:MAG: YkgJ family cysteine cluster protein [Chitinophagaceae bacterium]